MLSNNSKVTLREITKDTFYLFCQLSVQEEQKKFVADNAVSIAQAYYYERAWFQGIYADETPVGFLMLDDNPEKPEYFLWRFMIDAQYQGFGFGQKAISLLVEHVKTRPNATELLTSVVEGEGGPKDFYEKSGFKPTGEYDDGEAVLKLVF